MEDFFSSTAAADAENNNNGSNSSLFDTTEEIDELILSLLPPDELEALQREASAYVSRSLQLQQDVESRAQQLLVDVNRDRNDALAALRSVTGEQLTSVRKGILRYANAEKAMQELGTAFSQMDALIGTMQSVSSYQSIRQLHHYHENLSSVLKWTECLELFDQESAKKARADGAGITATMTDVEKELFGDGEEGEPSCTGPRLHDIYQQLRVMQQIRARLSIPSVAHEQRMSINAMRKHIECGEAALGHFLQKMWSIFRKAPLTLVDIMLEENPQRQAKVRKEHELLIAAVKIANQEALEPGIYSNINIAAYHLEIAINRTAGKSGAAAASGGKSSKLHQPTVSTIARPDTEIVSSICWDEIAYHVKQGTRSLFIDTICRGLGDPALRELPVDALLANVAKTVECIQDNFEDVCEALSAGMDGVPVGSGVHLLPHIMKCLHAEFCSLVEQEYCDPRSSVVVNDLLKVLQLVLFYKANSLEAGMVGQYVPPTAVDDVATRVLEVAVGGMRDELGTTARNVALVAMKKDVLPDSKTGLVGTVGPNDLLSFLFGMLASIKNNTSSEVRTRMSLACATALRFYVDTFSEKLQYSEFPKWYGKLVTVANWGDRWVLWMCTAINDFLELQRTVGKLDANLFDLRHQAGAANSSGQQQQQSGGGGAKLSALQSFAAMLGQEVFLKLIYQISDYLELQALKKLFDDATSKGSFEPASDKREAMARFIEEVRSYAVESIQPLLMSPWNAIAARNIMYRMIQLYIQRVLAKIYDGFDKVVSRKVLAARLGDDLRAWTTACGDLAEVVTDQLRSEERTPNILPDIASALGAVRLLLRLAETETVDALKTAIRDEAAQYHDMPEYVFAIMFEKNTAAKDLSSATKTAMQRVWKEHLQDMAGMRKAAELLKQQQMSAGDDNAAAAASAAAAAAEAAAFHSDNSTAGAGAAVGSASAAEKKKKEDAEAAATAKKQQQTLATADTILKFTTPTIFAGLDEDRVLPTKKGWLYGSKRDDSAQEIGYRLGQVKVCFEKVQIKEGNAPILLNKKEEKVMTMEEALALAAAKKKAAVDAAEAKK